MHDTLTSGREGLMQSKVDREKRKNSDQNQLDKISGVKTSLKSFFMSKQSKDLNMEKLTQAIYTGDQEVNDFDKLSNFLTIYHAKVAIPAFKKEQS